MHIHEERSLGHWPSLGARPRIGPEARNECMGTTFLLRKKSLIRTAEFGSDVASPQEQHFQCISNGKPFLPLLSFSPPPSSPSSQTKRNGNPRHRPRKSPHQRPAPPHCSSLVRIQPGVITGDNVRKVFEYARANQVCPSLAPFHSDRYTDITLILVRYSGQCP